jgi:hypothetical protein
MSGVGMSLWLLLDWGMAQLCWRLYWAGPGEPELPD